MKKLIALFLVAVMSLSCLVGCNGDGDLDDDLKNQDGGTDNQDKSYVLPRPETNLEFWIGENVDNVDFSNYQENPDIMGGRLYYGTGYVPTFDEHGQPVDPEHCVLYTVTSFPDYSDEAQHVTHIHITDPSVEFYGISLNSTFEEFEAVMKAQGFTVTSPNGNFLLAKKGKYIIGFSNIDIDIRVEVENREGIEF